MCLTSKAEQDDQQPPSHTVFINYYKEDSASAQRLYSDLKAASLNPWIDRENLLPGRNKSVEIENAIRRSDYFVALLSKISLRARGDVTRQIRTALEVQKEISSSQTFFIPVRLDEIDLPFDELSELQHVDMFPNWEDGLEKILKSMKVDHDLIKSVITHQRTVSPFVSLDVPQGATQIQTFKGEKQFFVGGQDYINQIIGDELLVPGSKVSIVGPGGSGKSQLAFKAIHQYVKEGIFDFVIPIYFDEGLIPFDKFLLQMAEIMGVKADDFEFHTNIKQRKGIIRDLLKSKKHPLIFLDNFETVSLILNRRTNSETKDSIQNARQITDFLNNIVPSENTSILATSREKKNNLSDEYPVDLEGLNLEDSMRLFNNYVRPIFKDSKGKTRDQIVEILKKTGGHPLTIEIIAKNLRGLHELNILQNLLELKGDPTQPEERFQTLQASFDYTIKSLDNKLQELILKLTLFKSPFPIFAAVEIFGITENEISDLYDRSLLYLVNSDKLYGKIQDPEYWLYNFYLPVRNYIEDTIRKNKQSFQELETVYGKKFSDFYLNLLQSTYDSIGTEKGELSLARFNIIYQGKGNDFERAANIIKDRDELLRANILSSFGEVLTFVKRFSSALSYHKMALDIYIKLDDKYGMARDYRNIGVLYDKMGMPEDAQEYQNKALNTERINADTLFNKGLDHKNSGRYKEALECFERARHINPINFKFKKIYDETAILVKNYRSNKIFVSYSRIDATDFAEHIRRHLLSFNYEVFTDISSIKVGEIWNSVIGNNISICNIFVVVVTPGSLKSQSVEKEVLQAKRENKKIIPCIYSFVRKDQIKWNLDRVQGIEFNDKFELSRNLYSKIENLID